VLRNPCSSSSEVVDLLEVARPAGSLVAVDPSREGTLVLEGRMSADVHRNVAFVKDLRQGVDRRLHRHEQVAAAAVEQRPMWAVDAQDQQASVSVAAGPMLASLVETPAVHSDPLEVQAGQVAGSYLERQLAGYNKAHQEAQPATRLHNVLKYTINTMPTYLLPQSSITRAQGKE